MAHSIPVWDENKNMILLEPHRLHGALKIPSPRRLQVVKSSLRRSSNIKNYVSCGLLTQGIEI